MANDYETWQTLAGALMDQYDYAAPNTHEQLLDALSLLAMYLPAADVDAAARVLRGQWSTSDYWRRSVDR